MMKILAGGLLLALAAAGCQPASVTTGSTGPVAVAPAPPPASGAPSGPAGGPPGGPGANASAGDRLTGAIKSVSGDTVTLADGKTFTMNISTRFSKTNRLTVSDIQKGNLVAITAVKQPDDSLLASIVSVFPPATSVPQGQFPLSGSNLMTNASVDSIAGNTMMVSFAGQTAKVVIAPDAQVTSRGNATAADLKEGVLVTVQLMNGIAQTINLM